MIEEVAAAVLVGGRSSRMGTDKAALDPFGQGTMLGIAVGALHDAGVSPVAVVGADPTRDVPPFAEAVPDEHPDEGPLGGIITALRWSPHDLVVVIACDMPFLTAEPIAGLISAARSSPEVAGVLVELDGRAQPLTAIWRRSLALEVLSTAFATGERAPRRLLDALPIATITCADPDALIDLDSPTDVHRYAHLARDRKTGEF